MSETLMLTWLVIAASYLSLPLALAVLAWCAKRRAHLGTQSICAKCGYSRDGLQTSTRCPECGTLDVNHAWHTLPWTAARVAVSLLAPSVTAVIAASLALATAPLETIPGAIAAAIFPYAIAFLMILVLYQPVKHRFWLAFALVLAGGCNSLLAIVMLVSYKWPNFLDEVILHGNVMVLSSLYFWTFVAMSVGWGIARARNS